MSKIKKRICPICMQIYEDISEDSDDAVISKYGKICPQCERIKTVEKFNDKKDGQLPNSPNMDNSMHRLLGNLLCIIASNVGEEFEFKNILNLLGITLSKWVSDYPNDVNFLIIADCYAYAIREGLNPTDIVAWVGENLIKLSEMDCQKWLYDYREGLYQERLQEDKNG